MYVMFLQGRNNAAENIELLIETSRFWMVPNTDNLSRAIYINV